MSPHENEPRDQTNEQHGVTEQTADDVAVPDEPDGGATERPDPSDVPSLSREETLHQRDEHGKLMPETSVVEMPSGWRKVKHKPLTRGLLNRFEREFSGEEVDWEEMDAAIADFYLDPSYDADELEDMDPGVYITLMMHIVEKVEGDLDDEITESLADEVEQRADDTAGN